MNFPPAMRGAAWARGLTTMAWLGGIVGAGCAHSPASASVSAPPTAAPALTMAVAQAAAKPPSTAPRVALGIDVLAAQNFSILRGKRVGLLTHPAGVNRNGVSTIEMLRRAPGVKLVALYEPEHGIYGNFKAEVYTVNRMDPRTGLPIYSLHNDTKKPTPAMLKDIDVMVVDLQDIGTRSYTFISCLHDTMEACFEQGKTVVVLDRPNPLGGLKVGGPKLDEANKSYVGRYPIPYIHGLTIGELARMAKGSPGWLDISDDARRRGQLIVVPMSGWRRSMLWPDTGLKWVPTSTNIPTVSAAFGYGEVGLAGVISGGFGHGIGTPYPFRLLNHPAKTPVELAAALRALRLPGLDFVPQTYKGPDGVERSGVYVQITDWNVVVPTQLAFEMMRLTAAWSTGGNPFANATPAQVRSFSVHVGSSEWLREMQTKGGRADVAGHFRKWNADAAEFQQQSRRWWLYPE